MHIRENLKTESNILMANELKKLFRANCTNAG